LSTGSIERIPEGVALEKVTLSDYESVINVFKNYQISGVLHLAAKKSVAESVERPDYYWQENVEGFNNLLHAMELSNVKKLVFSSSASVYGEPTGVEPITENFVCSPINPYGKTKLEGELLAKQAAENWGLNVFALRYFNVAGASNANLGDHFALNLIPLVFKAIDASESPTVFGNDYPTNDGTCVRDYIDVRDLATAHIAAMNLLDRGKTGFTSVNIGTGMGSSVLDVLRVVEQVTQVEMNPKIIGRRTGDPASLTADVSLAKDVLGWSSTFDLEDMVTSAWGAWSNNKA
jgi:UDP-glucose 4-epimerase